MFVALIRRQHDQFLHLLIVMVARKAFSNDGVVKPWFSGGRHRVQRKADNQVEQSDGACPQIALFCVKRPFGLHFRWQILCGAKAPNMLDNATQRYFETLSQIIERPDLIWENSLAWCPCNTRHVCRVCIPNLPSFVWNIFWLCLPPIADCVTLSCVYFARRLSFVGLLSFVFFGRK